VPRGPRALFRDAPGESFKVQDPIDATVLYEIEYQQVGNDISREEEEEDDDD